MEPTELGHYAASWRKKAAEREALASRKRHEAREKAKKVAAHLRSHGARAVYLFGSLAWGGFDERSDIDIAVEGLQDNGRYFGILDEISELARPFEIQMVTLETAPPGLKESVLRDGVPL